MKGIVVQSHRPKGRGRHSPWRALAVAGTDTYPRTARKAAETR